MPPDTGTSQDPNKPYQKALITLVHGTWPRGMLPGLRTKFGQKRPCWFEDDSPFRESLSKMLTSLGVPYEIDSLPWTGSNSIADRAAAAECLARRLECQQRENPTAEQFIIGHSHGGTVAMLACEQLADDMMSPHLITLSTPFVQAGVLFRSAKHYSALFGFMVLCTITFSLSLAVVVGPHLIKYVPGYLALLCFLGCGAAIGWVIKRSLMSTRQRSRQIVENMLGGLRPERRKSNTFVLRCVDDEALLTIAAGSIANRTFTNMFSVVSMGWSGIGMLGFAFLWNTGIVRLPVPWSFRAEPLPLLFWLLIVLGMAYTALLIAGLARSSYGRELAFGSYNLQINSQSTPDHSAVEVETLFALDEETLRHSIYNRKEAPTYVAAWIWKIMDGVKRDVSDYLTLNRRWEFLKARHDPDDLASIKVAQLAYGR